MTKGQCMWWFLKWILTANKTTLQSRDVLRSQPAAGWKLKQSRSPWPVKQPHCWRLCFPLLVIIFPMSHSPLCPRQRDRWPRYWLEVDAGLHCCVRWRISIRAPLIRVELKRKLSWVTRAWRPSWCSSRGRNTKRKRLNAHKYVSGSWCWYLLDKEEEEEEKEVHSENAQTNLFVKTIQKGTLKTYSIKSLWEK